MRRRTPLTAGNFPAAHLAQVDGDRRRRLGLRPHDNGSIACWLTHREVMRDLVANGPEMMAVFEDDARLTPKLPEVLDALELKPFSFDVVSLYRGHPRRAFIPCFALTGRLRRRPCTVFGHRLRGIRRHPGGSQAFSGEYAQDDPGPSIMHCYVSGSAASTHFTSTRPPSITAGHTTPRSTTDATPRARRYATTTNPCSILWRRAIAGGRRSVKKRLAFRRLLRGDIGVTRWR